MLVAVGIGPGDPELLTVKAVNLIKAADRVFVPGKVARDIIAPYRTDPVVLSFPMTADEDYIKRCIEENARTIAPVARDGLAVFCILGDPNFYGTFGRLCAVLDEVYPEIEYHSIPGVSSITAFASATGTALSGGIVITDGSELTAQIRMKVRRPQEVADELRKSGYSTFLLAERMYMDGQRIYGTDDLPEESAYFSILYAGK
ncbi:cobalt-precorrin-2 C(20)-methyltransferase [Methanomicrobiaceae archaeon CYW5]|uniref:cobalt-factor II C(20)-methyltransferase n=1 Tax=Methanovulcanius yangii TaxID=1789227 RepID=UPI0029CA6E7C|nr:cobalt-factor II C(20)-methyltransferase [Methanovulcanius yangii]MBT8507636.1 cobalt-precorrin-2 C(20)-methyltransferase [Methanovulcanius yangii]